MFGIDEARNELLQVLGLSRAECQSEADVEAARMQLCSALHLPLVTPDAALVAAARQAGYVPPTRQQSFTHTPQVQPTVSATAPPAAQAPATAIPASASPTTNSTFVRGGANADELAQIPRRTQTGMQKVSTVRGTTTTATNGIKPLHSRSSSADLPEVTDEQLEQHRMQQLATSQRTKSLRDAEPAPTETTGIVGLFKKLLGK